MAWGIFSGISGFGAGAGVEVEVEAPVGFGQAYKWLGECLPARQ